MNLNLLKFLLVGTGYILVTAVDKDSNQIVDCIVQAVHLIAKRKIAIEFTEDSQDLATHILQKVNVPVVLNIVEHRIPTGIEYRTSIDVLLLFRDEEAANILNYTLWNGDTKFIIITDDVKTVEDYFDQFWKLKVINVFGIVMTVGNTSLYSFLPYTKENCTKPQLIIVDSCLEGKLQYGGTALKDLTRIKNMNQCPINVTITHVRPSVIFEPDEGKITSSTAKGFEGRFMVEVARLYNFNATFKIAEDGIGWGWIYPSPRGAIGDLWRGITDITIGMQAPLMQRYEFLDLAANFNMDECVTFGVPQGYGAKRGDLLAIFVLEFTYPTWITIMFSFVIISINMWLINRYLNLNWLKSKSEIALFLFSSCLGMPIKTPQYTSAKTSAIFWILFSFIVTVAYKASMGSKLAVPPHDPDINTFQELLDSDLELMGLRNMIQTMEPKDEWPFTEFRRRYKFTNDCMEHFIERMANHEKVSYLRHRSSFYYFSLINPKTRGRIHLIEDCMLNYHPYAVLKKFSPFTRRVSQIVRRLEESGIMEMWRAEFQKKVPPPKKPFFKLSIEQMMGVFCFLLVGYGVAMFVFLCEVYINSGFRKSLSVILPFTCLRCNKENTVKAGPKYEGRNGIL